MIRQKLLIIAFVLTLGLGRLFLPLVQADAQSASTTPSPSASVSVSPSLSPSTSPTVSPSVSPSPSPIYTASGSPLVLWQQKWKQANNSTDIVTIGDEAKQKTKKSSFIDLPEIDIAQAEGSSDDGPGELVGPPIELMNAGGGSGGGLGNTILSAAPYVGYAIAAYGLIDGIVGLFSSEDEKASRPDYCFNGGAKAGVYTWDQYIVKKNIEVGTSKGTLYGKSNAKLNESYLISNTFAAGDAASAEWKNLDLIVQYPRQKTIKVYYRVSDTGGITDPNDTSWRELADPAVVPSACHYNERKKASYKVDGTGKFFQYKINMITQKSGRDGLKADSKDKQNVEKVAITVQPLSVVQPSPSPTVSSTPTTPTPTATNVGKITIQTRKLVVSNVNPSPTPSSGAPLPDLSPTPTPVTSTAPTATASGAAARPAVNPICFDDQDTDVAPNVPLSVRQTSGGSVSIEDQETDDEGNWFGKDGEIDELPSGTYAINFKTYEKTDYKLVALCVTPDDGEHHLKTQTSPTGGKATVIVRPGQDTKVTALYAPRSKPYISMNKFALDTKNKIIKSIVPGQTIRYLIRYENTGDNDAKNVNILDVIPEQFFVPDTEKEFLDGKSDFTTNIDALGRTTITKKIDVLKKGQKGSITIPVLLRADAFGSPADIANATNQETQRNSSAASTTPPVAGSANSNGALELR